MARLFPLRSETPSQEGRPRVVDLDDEDADAVFSALSSTTARRIYTRLNEEPGTPSDVADAIDSSIQNVRYHLEKLEDAGLVEVVDTWYSSRGNEMSVYATTDGPLIVTSDRSRGEQLKAALSRFLGGVAGLAGASLLVQYGATRFFEPAGDAGTAPAADGGGDAGGDGASADVEGRAETEDAPDDSDPGDDAAVDDGGGDATTDGGGDGGGMTTADVDDGADAGDAADPGDETADADADAASVDGDAGGDGASADAGEIDGDVAVDDPSVIDNLTDVDGGAETAETVVSVLPPGALFFLGGLLVLTAVTGYWYWRTY